MPKIDPANVKVGLYLPNGDGMMSPGIHRWKDVLRLAQKTEAAGLDSVWVADHMIFRLYDQPTEGRWECWQMLGAIAAVTERVEIGPLVTCMGFRNPALLAKIAETTDEISDGRLILGLGAGWHEPEFTSYGYPYDRRASRFEEGFQVLQELIRTGESTFHGLYYTTDGAEMRPRGPRNGGMPIMIGTDGPRLLQLTARYADIWNTTWTHSADEAAPRVAALDAACESVQRDPDTIGRSCCVFIDVEGARGVYTQYGTSKPNPRLPEQIAEFITSYADLGVDHLMVWLDPYTEEAIDQLAEGVRYLRG
ncbi:MAG: LLM class flavin-dependent oxidoreductase [Thermomicrobiales bacterium]|nr:LLM class flavin-dependent oxidoreductase [Thermomicrobiales bacterium]